VQHKALIIEKRIVEKRLIVLLHKENKLYATLFHLTEKLNAATACNDERKRELKRRNSSNIYKSGGSKHGLAMRLQIGWIVTKQVRFTHVLRK
jgi:hypothetical protein